jgi:Zn-finger nucleic acid-binding protein
MNCPKDATPLASERYEADVKVDRCPSCRGLWLDAGELERIQVARERDNAAVLSRMPALGFDAVALAEAKAARKLACPKCGDPLGRREYGFCSQVLIDVCPRCHGIWLDDRELVALEVFFERARGEADDVGQSFFSGLRGLLD